MARERAAHRDQQGAERDAELRAAPARCADEARARDGAQRARRDEPRVGLEERRLEDCLDPLG